MTSLTKLTPAEDYALRMINALDGFIDNPDNIEWSDEILMFILERPKTLRSALSAYLYKSQSARLTRGTINEMAI